LLGRVEPDDIGLLTPEDEKTADWLLGRTVTAVEPAAVTLDDGSESPPTASCSPPRPPPPTTATGPAGVHTLRTVENALALRAAIRPAPGSPSSAGLIGSEVAASTSAPR